MTATAATAIPCGEYGALLNRPKTSYYIIHKLNDNGVEEIKIENPGEYYNRKVANSSQSAILNYRKVLRLLSRAR